jgi:hypothetical protein
MSELKTAAKKSKAPPSVASLDSGKSFTQLDRINVAIARLPRFDKFWLEKLSEVLEEAQNRPPHGKADGSVNAEAWGLAQTLLKRAADWNLLRSHPSFPKSFVGE